MRASYATYKSTSIPWLPEMPEHWDLIGLNLLFKDNKNKNKGMVESLVLSLSYGNIIRKQREENFGLIPESFETYQILEPGYIVMRLTDLQNDKRSLRVGYVKERGIITSAYTGLVPGKVDSKYYYYLLHYLDIRKHFYSLGGGVRQSSDYNEIKKTKVTLPPLPEQTAIANYLDAKTEQINRFIEKKEKLIALLKEQKQAVINELLEDKEGKWERRKLKYFCSLITKGTTPSTEGKEFTNSGVRFLKAENITENGLSESPWFFIDEATNQILKRSQLKANDILIVIAGATIGRTAIITESFLPANTNQAVCLLRLKKDVDPKFIRLLLSSPKIQERVRFDAVQSAQPNLSMGVLGDFLLPYPKLESERQQLVNTIEEESMRIDAVIQRITVEIEKVKELKQSLIAEVVTGKIKII
jgi:type I restriction enzyme, S subunit